MYYGRSLLTLHMIMLPPFSGFSVLKMVAVGSSKMAINFYQATWHHNAEDSTLLEVMLV